MKDILAKKSVGFYFVIVAAIVGIVAAARYMMWAPAHNSMDNIVMAALVIGVVLDVILMVKDSPYLVVLTTICYSIALFKHLTGCVGSFVDALQGITMFGDATQVGTIVTIAMIIAVSVLLSIIASFLSREKNL